MQLQQYLRMIQRGWWIIALSTLAALAVALMMAYNQTPQYRTTASFVLGPRAELMDGGRDLVNSLTALDKRSIAATYAEVLGSDLIYQEAGTALQIDPALLRNYELTAVVLPEANVLQLSAIGPDPELGARLTNTVGQIGIDYVTRLYQVYTLSFLDQAKPSLESFSPQPARDGALALALGLAIGVVLAIGREQLRMPIEAFLHRSILDGPSGAHTRAYVLRWLDMYADNPPIDLSVGLVRLEELHSVLTDLPPALQQQILRKVTAIFRNELRGSDVVGRWDDTSFMVLLPQTQGVAAVRTIERIHRALSKPLEIDNSNSKIALQPRAGVTTRQNGESISTLLQRTEQSLEHTRPNAQSILQGNDVAITSS